MDRADIQNCKRCVVKVGSALLTNHGTGLDTGMIDSLAEQIFRLRAAGVSVVLVSSGSVAAGVAKLKMGSRPDKVNELQAAAAVGQAALVRHYEQAFLPLGITIAQVLLTHADVENRERYLNARGTFNTLLDMDVLPVVNENDSVATEEICFGDNDSLGALVTNLVSAELMIILTDQDGLFDKDPRHNKDAILIQETDADNSTLPAMATDGGKWGRGGMITKVSAAQIAARSGANTVIANGADSTVLSRIFNGERVGTLLKAKQAITSKKQWMASQLKPKGKFWLDSGAVQVLSESGRSLLPVGITKVEGDFNRGELISCLDSQGHEIARGLSNYNSSEAQKIAGKVSEKIAQELGYGGDDEIIHRDNLVLI